MYPCDTNEINENGYCHVLSGTNGLAYNLFVEMSKRIYSSSNGMEIGSSTTLEAGIRMTMRMGMGMGMVGSKLGMKLSNKMEMEMGSTSKIFRLIMTGQECVISLIMTGDYNGVWWIRHMEWQILLATHCTLKVHCIKWATVYSLKGSIGR